MPGLTYEAEKQLVSDLKLKYEKIIKSICVNQYKRYDKTFLDTMVNIVFQIFIRKATSCDRDVFLNHKMHLFKKRYFYYIKEAWKIVKKFENDKGGITKVPKDENVYFDEVDLFDEYNKVSVSSKDNNIDEYNKVSSPSKNINIDVWDSFYDILLSCLDIWKKKNKDKKNTKRDYEFFMDFYIKKLNKRQIHNKYSIPSERRVGEIINGNIVYMQKCIPNQSDALYGYNILERLL